MVRWAGIISLVVLSMGCGPDTNPSTSDSSGEGSGSGSGSSTQATTDPSQSGPDPDGGSGSDGSGTGTSTGQQPPAGCSTVLESNLPGVSIEIEGECALPLTQAIRGVNTRYRLVIEQPHEQVETAAGCTATPEGSVHVQWLVHGNGRAHCRCDEGNCSPGVAPTTLVPGETMHDFVWLARDWSGPSDFGAPLGAPWEPGDYTIELTIEGTWDDGRNATAPLLVRATKNITLTE